MSRERVLAGEFVEGVWEGIPDDIYHALPGISSTAIREATRSMAAFRRYVSGEREPISKAALERMELGTQAHMAVLEPSRWEAMEVHGKRRKRVNAIVPVVEAAMNRRTGVSVGEVLFALPESSREVTLLWRDPVSDLECKGRIDLPDYSSSTAIDLKFTDQDLRQWCERSVWNSRYHHQAAWYLRGCLNLGVELHYGAVLPVSWSSMASAGVLTFDDDTIKAARGAQTALLIDIAKCRDENRWPDYEPEDCFLTAPRWA